MFSAISPAAWSLIALLVAIVLSVTSKINVGLVAIALTWGIGVYIAKLPADTVLAGFPTSLFITLTGVTLLFAVADVNGTLERLAHRVLGLARGHGTTLAAIFFVGAMFVSSIGPGSVATVALLVPMAMVIGTRAGLSPLIVSLMVANGANAGNLSPFSAVGVIANTKMAQAGITGHEGKVWFANFAAHVLVAIAAYWLFQVWRPAPRLPATATLESASAAAPLSRAQWGTVAVTALWILAVVVLKVNLGLAAFGAATLLLAAGVADENAAVRKVPWGIILMVTGVSLLIALLEKTGGMTLFAGLLARFASPSSVNGVIAFVTGAISTYSSTSGVVLPAFLPSIPSLVQQLGGGDPLAIALSINVGASIVDVSPLSTLGALCLATVADPAVARDLFRRLLAWGLSMTIVAAVLCQLFAGALARF